ncbi:MAG: F0F1 ATP synthase subunit A [Planctomycetota bacterium]
MLAILVGACFLTARHTPHHTATEDTIFTTLYMHVVPAPIVAASGHGGDHHGADDHSGGSHAADDHGHHEAVEPLFSIPLPGFLSFFRWDPERGKEHAGEHAHDEHESPRLVVYNLQIFQLAALLMILVAFSGVPRFLRTGEGDPITRLMAGFCLWLRDDVVEPSMGKELADKLLPLMMFTFFFILFMNTMGLAPMSVTPTASIFVTAALALITFTLMIVGGFVAQGPVAFFKNLVPDVPLFLWPLMFVIELAGLIIKPIALMIRLFATMTGGHLVVLSFLALIFFFATSFNTTIAATLSPVWVGFAVFIMVIEAFVALVQAYIFTLLSSLFIGASVHPEH